MRSARITMKQGNAWRIAAVRAVEVDSFADYAETMEVFAALTGRDDLYQKNVEEVRARIDALVSQAAGRIPDGTDYLCLKINAAKKHVLKNDNFACEILNAMGLRNAARDDSTLDEPSLEAVAAINPDWIFVILEGAEAAVTPIYEEAFSSQAVWSNLSAVRDGRSVLLPPNLFLYKPNARWDKA